jgi:hypothetical protein
MENCHSSSLFYDTGRFKIYESVHSYVNLMYKDILYRSVVVYRNQIKMLTSKKS